MERPRIRIEPEPFDQFLDAAGFLALAVLIGLPLYYYESLPDIIPRHFGADGTPDGYSGKAIIWTLPLIGALMFFGMRWISGKPHWFNYTQKITQENAAYQYRNAVRMIRVMNTMITGAFAYMCSATIMTALGEQEGLGNYFTPVFLIILFGALGYFLIRASRK